MPPPAAASPARSLYRALLRALRPLARSGGDLSLKAPLDADTAWGQHRFAPAGAAYEQEALAALIPGGGELPVPPDALFPPASVPAGSGASPDFVPQRRYRAADLRQLVAANFRAPLSPTPAALVPRMAQALAALRALPEQLVLERGSSVSWHEGVLVEATARFMHATPPVWGASSASSASSAAAAIGGGAVPLSLPPHVQAAAARLLGVAAPPGGGSSGNEAEDDEEDEEDEEDDSSGADRERRARLRLARRRQADAARQHVFTYRVRVTNARPSSPSSICTTPPRVQILGREWSIWDGHGDLKGLVPLSTANAVVGQQPVLPFGACFEYSSGTPLEAPRRPGTAFSGSMRGRLALAVREDGVGAGGGGGGRGGGRLTASPLVVPIAEFRLVAPSSDPREEEEELGEGEEDEGGRRTRRRRAAAGQERWRWLAGGG